jgi:hypothetical protein
MTATMEAALPAMDRDDRRVDVAQGTVTSTLNGLVRGDPRTGQEFLAPTTRSDNGA